MTDRLLSIPIIFAIRFINFLFRFISVETAWNIGECLGSLCYKIMPSRRAIIDYNTEVVANATGDFAPSPELTESIFQRNCANLTCIIKTYGMTPAQLGKHVTINVSQSCRDTVTNKSGAIFCLAHMGNWEILSKISPLMDLPFDQFGAIYRPLDNKATDAYVIEQRQQYNCQMFSKTTSLNTLSTFIRNAGILGILADQRSGSAKNARPFFNVDSARSKLPAVLHHRTKAPLFSVSVHSPMPGQWTVDIEPILSDPASSSVEDTVKLITQSYEKNFSKHLLDVFWLHRYWRKGR